MTRPAAEALPLRRRSGVAALREGWLPRHTVAMGVLTPAAFAGYLAASGAGFDSPAWIALVAAMSPVAALILATYLPLRGAGPTRLSSCTAMTGLLVPGAGILLSQGSGILSGVLALAILGLGLWQRLSGTPACG